MAITISLASWMFGGTTRGKYALQVPTYQSWRQLVKKYPTPPYHCTAKRYQNKKFHYLSLTNHSRHSVLKIGEIWNSTNILNVGARNAPSFSLTNTKRWAMPSLRSNSEVMLPQYSHFKMFAFDFSTSMFHWFWRIWETTNSIHSEG